MARCPYCGRDYMTAANYTKHIRVCEFGHRVEGYQAQLEAIKKSMGKC